MNVELVIYAGLINWLVTTIFVESTLFAPYRDYFVQRGLRVWIGDEKLPRNVVPQGYTPEQLETARVEPDRYWGKLAQFVTCHMCTGVWVGLAEALYFGGPLHGWAAVVANALLYKAVGHLVLELRSRVAK